MRRQACNERTRMLNKRTGGFDVLNLSDKKGTIVPRFVPVALQDIRPGLDAFQKQFGD